MEPRPRLNTLLPSIALTIATLGVPACAQIEQIEAHNRAIVRATQVAPHTDDGTKNDSCKVLSGEAFRTGCEKVLQASAAIGFSLSKKPMSPADLSCSATIIDNTPMYVYWATAEHCLGSNLAYLNYQLSSQTNVTSAPIQAYEIGLGDKQDIIVVAVKKTPELDAKTPLHPVSHLPGSNTPLIIVGAPGILDNYSNQVFAVAYGETTGKPLAVTVDGNRKEFPYTNEVAMRNDIFSPGMSGGAVTTVNGEYVGPMVLADLSGNRPRGAYTTGAFETLTDLKGRLNDR